MYRKLGKSVSIDDLKEGKPEAFRKIYQDYYRMISTFIKKNNGTEDDAQDIFQEILMIFIKNVRKPDFELTAKISTYLYSIARNLWLKRIRKSKNIVELKDYEGFEELEDFGEEEINQKKEREKKHELIARVLKQLKEDCRKLILDFYYNKKALNVIAEEMGYTYAFAKVKKNRCMNGFKKMIQSNEDFLSQIS